MLGESPAPRVPSAPMLQAADTAAGVTAAVAVAGADAPSWQDMAFHNNEVAPSWQAGTQHK